MTAQSRSDYTPHCVVIGAGFAGVAASIRLVEAGWRVTLTDKRTFAGGRVYSIVDAATREEIDNGQHVLMGCYTHTLHILRQLGTFHHIEQQKSLKVHFAQYREENLPLFFTLDTSLLPGKAGLIAGILKLNVLSAREKWQFLTFALQIMSGLVKTKGLSTLELLRKYHQSERAITLLWEPIILATLNAAPKDAAASLLVEVFRRAFFADSFSSSLLIPRVPLSSLLSPLPDWLGHRNSTFMPIAVQRLSIHNNRIQAVELMNSTKIPVDAVISAIPANSLQRLIPEAGFQHIPHHHYSPIISVSLWFDRVFFSMDFTAMIGTTIQWIFNRRRLTDTSPMITKQFPEHLSLTISAGANIMGKTNEEIIALCLQEIHLVFPASEDAVLLRAKVIREKYATPLITPEVESKRLSAATPLYNLFLAGDWTNTGLPATIEGAAQSGIHAAEMLITKASFYPT